MQTTYSKMKDKGKMVMWSLSSPEYRMQLGPCTRFRKSISVNRCFSHVFSALLDFRREGFCGHWKVVKFIEELDQKPRRGVRELEAKGE